MKEYEASKVFNAVSRTQAELDAAGGAGLKLYDVHNASQHWRKANPDTRLGGDKQVWTQQLIEASAYAGKEGLFVQDVQTQVTIQGELRHEVAIVFGRHDLLAILKARGYLTLMDSTHQTNHLDWKLFTLMVRDAFGTWVPCAHFLTKFEDHDIVAKCLDVVIEASGGWHPRYLMTDDSAAEQLAVKKCFEARGILSGEMDVQHLLCHKHLDATLRKRFKGDRYKKTLECVLAAVKYRRTATGAEDSLRQAINALPKTGQQSFMDGTLRPKEEDLRYIQRELWQKLRLAAVCYRDHSQILLQVRTTNALESFHAQLKLGTKGSMQNFTLKGTIEHIFDVMGRYDKRRRETERMFRASVHPMAAEHEWLRPLPWPIQKLIANEINAAEDGPYEDEWDKLESDTRCSCRFWRSYNVLCRHIWSQHLAVNHLTKDYFDRLGHMFDDCGYELYEARISERLEGEEEEELDTADMRLEVRDVLSNLQARFYELEEQAQDADTDFKLAVLEQWLGMIQRAGGESTRQAVAAFAAARDEPMPPPSQRIADVMDPTAQLPSSTPISTACPRPEPQPASQQDPAGSLKATKRRDKGKGRAL